MENVCYFRCYFGLTPNTSSAAHTNYKYLAIPHVPCPGSVTLKVIHISGIKEGYINTLTQPLILY